MRGEDLDTAFAEVRLLARRPSSFAFVVIHAVFFPEESAQGTLLLGAAGDLMGERPNVDSALVVLARALGLPPGAVLALFALGRTVGWIGHAIEQYETDRIIRPCARYIGEQPPTLERHSFGESRAGLHGGDS